MASEQMIRNASRALPYLVECAKAHRTVTYGELADKVGVHVRAVRHFLYYIRDEICIPRRLPLLTAIVVHKGDEQPGDSWHPNGLEGLSPQERRDRFEQSCKEVFAYAFWDVLLDDLNQARAPDMHHGIDTAEQMRSLSMELDALKNRVRNIIHDAHWLADGEWKESVLRTVLRRHVPTTVGVGRGYVVRPHGCSGQIDILLHDTSGPVLHRDGDLVFVTPDVVRAIIEVKTQVSSVSELQGFLTKLTEKTPFVGSAVGHITAPFVGLFAYETTLTEASANEVLAVLQRLAGGDPRKVITHLTLGQDLFVRFWRNDPMGSRAQHHDSWHLYRLERQAAGYFISNVVASVAHESVRRNELLWFDPTGKEPRRIATLSLR